MAAPLSGRDTAVFNLGVQLHTIMPHASSYLATCEQQVIGACCMFAIAAAASRSHPPACAPPLAAVGLRRLELALSRLLPFLAPEESQWRSHHISLSLCPAALPTVSRRQTGPSLSRRRPSPPQPRSSAQAFATRNVAVRERSERKQTETMRVLGCRHTLSRESGPTIPF